MDQPVISLMTSQIPGGPATWTHTHTGRRCWQWQHARLPALWHPRLTAPSSHCRHSSCKLSCQQSTTEAAKDSRTASSGMPTLRDSTQKIHLTHTAPTRLQCWGSESRTLSRWMAPLGKPIVKATSTNKQIRSGSVGARAASLRHHYSAMRTFPRNMRGWREDSASLSPKISSRGSSALFWAPQAADTCAHTSLPRHDKHKKRHYFSTKDRVNFVLEKDIFIRKQMTKYSHTWTVEDYGKNLDIYKIRFYWSNNYQSKAFKNYV